jgi:hypothetical protein
MGGKVFRFSRRVALPPSNFSMAIGEAVDHRSLEAWLGDW